MNARQLARHYAIEFLKNSPGQWFRTQDIAAGIGLEHRAGQSLSTLRDALYNAKVYGHIEHEPKRNGHLWRFPTEGGGSADS